MKGQSLFFEYILLFLLSILLVSYTYSWFENNKQYIFQNFNIRAIEEEIKRVDIYFYNAEGFIYFKKKFQFNDYRIYCLGNYTIFKTGIRCKSYSINLNFSGYYINYNNQSYFYSNKTNVYYSAIKLGYFVYKSCYEGNIAYIFNTTYCNVFCSGNCKLYLEKNRTIIKWLYKP